MAKKTDKLQWHTEQRKVKELIPYEKNPRTMSESERQHLTESLEKFGLAEIPAINTDGKIAAGHQRVAIMIALGRGEETIDVRIPNRKLTADEFREYLLRSNKNTGSWEWEGLKDFGIDELLKVGFEDEDLGFMWDDVTMLEEDGFDVAKEAAAIKTPKSKIGDMYRLGDHTLAVGDATRTEDVKKLMGGGVASMIYSDPPYNIGLDYNKGISTGGKYKGQFEGQKQRKDGNQKFPDLKYKGFKLNDSKKVDDYSTFLNKTIQNGLDHTKEDAHIFYWCDENYIWLMQQLFSQNNLMLRRVCLWVKNNFNMTPQVAFNKVYEPCVYATKGKPFLNEKHKNLNELLNREIESGTQVQDEIQEMINIWLVKRDPAQDYEHPTQKPLSLHEKPLKRCTKVGDVVLDLFGGSGSTLIACEQLKRKCYTIEIDPIFADVIIKRWEKLTDRKAVKI